MFPGEIPGRSRLEQLGRRRGADRVSRNGRRRFVTKVNHFYNGALVLDVNEAYTSKTRSWDGSIKSNLGGAAAIRDTSGFGWIGT